MDTLINRHKPGACHAPQAPTERLVAAVWMDVYAVLTDPTVLDEALVRTQRGWLTMDERSARRQDLGNRTYVVLSLGGLAQVVAARGDRRRAARLLGTVTSQAQALGSTQFTAYATILKPLFQAIFDQAVVSQTVKLDETGNKAAWEEGSAMTLDQCVAYALGEKHPDRSCSDRANIGSSTDGAGLQTEH